MKIILALLITIHALIHLMGFAKAFNYANISQLTQPISKPAGIFWLLTAILFLILLAMLLLHKEYWWMIAVAAVLLSQILIFTSWTDAKFGTIANVIILIAAITGFGTWNFRSVYKKDVAAELKSSSISTELLTESDIQHLPEPVKKYLRYTGSVGKPKVKNFKIEFEGQIRKDEQSAWMPFTSEQYNFMDASTRLFFMDATMKHLPVVGYHSFKNGDAFMDIRLLSLLKVQYQSGKEMGIAETVTFFNDMCCMAPATLIDERIKWTETDSNKVKAEFTNNSITISAWLHFNETGELINFISDDRYAQQNDGTMKKLRWSTPLKDYADYNGYKLAGYADAIYNYPEGDLCYGQFRTKAAEYNRDGLK